MIGTDMTAEADSAVSFAAASPSSAGSDAPNLARLRVGRVDEG